jgi:hypothetical protein
MHTNIDYFSFKATQYCAWPRSAARVPRFDAVRAIRVLSGLLYSASKLPEPSLAALDVEPLTDDLSTDVAALLERMPVSCAARPGLMAECPHRARTGGLAGCLAETHAQIADGLRKYEHGRTREALAAWHHGFKYHWGQLAACALLLFQAHLETSELV